GGGESLGDGVGVGDGSGLGDDDPLQPVSESEGWPPPSYVTTATSPSTIGPDESALNPSLPSGCMSYVPPPTTTVADFTACASESSQCPPSVHGRALDPTPTPPVHVKDSAYAMSGVARTSRAAPIIGRNRFMSESPLH